jgi:HEAT repeat protein
LEHVLAETLEEDQSQAALRKQQLVELLQAENEYIARTEQQFIDSGMVASPETQLSEEYISYHSELLAAVISLKDASAVEALAGATSTGNMVMDAVADFGEIAIDPLIAQLDQGLERRRSTALFTLQKILDRVPDINNKPELLEKIRMSAIKAAGDSGPTVRIRAVELLAHFSDAESTEIIKEIANNDPYRAEFMPGSPYMVRDAATQILGGTRNRQ